MIPKILHQIWIGPLPPPLKMMETWKNKNPDFEYIYWNEAEIKKRNMTFACQQQIDDMPEYNGKADIMRWEILNKYGGYFVDADSICIEPFDHYFINKLGFATFENETVRQKLVATGTMGFIPKHHLLQDIIKWIQGDEAKEMFKEVRAWGTVGPGLLTRFLATGNYKDFTVYPSHCFLPIHFTGESYKGHKKVYGYQAWGTANNSYDKMNEITLPKQLCEPKFWVSVLVPSYNTPLAFLKECLDSIRSQNGHFGIELVWINDGSSAEHTAFLEDELNRFKNNSRFCKVIYHKIDENLGVSKSLAKGVELCNYELIFRIDSDDIMMPNRIAKQLEFMKTHSDCVVCGTNVKMFSNELEKRIMKGETNHPEKMTWQNFYSLKVRPIWLMNHPTLCFRKSAVLLVGNYNVTRAKDFYMEDYELEVKLMHKFGSIYNLNESLVYYRIHPGQITYTKKDAENELQDLIIKDIMKPTIPENASKECYFDDFDSW
jgi:glycosyltransferase involved in cell wall biosynthesis